MSGSTVLETFAYAYNADGQLTSASSPDSAYAYAYDGEGRETSVDNLGTPNVPHVVLSDQYDANGNRTSLAATIAGNADFQNVYTYDALNRLTQLYQAGQTGGNAVATKGANITYNLLGQLATIARTNFFGVGPAPDIATSTFSYDNANRLTEIANTTNGGTAIDAYSWAYDNSNRVTSMTTTTDGTATYSYDNTNQVTGATYTTNPGATQPANESYSYDSNGNRTNTGYSTGTNNQLSSDGTFNYTYDNEGNRITRTRISNNPANDYKTTYTWDYHDRLTDVEFYNNSDVLTKHVHYTYDVFDHLIGKQVDDTGGGTYDRAEFYVYDGNNIVLQFNGSGALAERYINGPSASGVDTVLAEEDVTSLTSPGNVTWPLTDNLGTVRDIVDSSGVVIDHLVYNSFGQVAYESAATVHHLQGYTGAIYDSDTGMVIDWHRWYDPAVGRWISEDPMGFAAGDANLNRYVLDYVTVSLDPRGLQVLDEFYLSQERGNTQKPAPDHADDTIPPDTLISPTLPGGPLLNDIEINIRPKGLTIDECTGASSGDSTRPNPPGDPSPDIQPLLCPTIKIDLERIKIDLEKEPDGLFKFDTEFKLKENFKIKIGGQDKRPDGHEQKKPDEHFFLKINGIILY